ncbi:LysR family transcriptional regulator [uncultured Friedmanniella sp.]|uniref:LysR family transcriptional regulator n=1 Tax=uncultured Friedmanniella sp. TaxID=335381 RepID=UPI0035CBF5C0
MADTLDLSQLRSFVAIADCGGFSRAASSLHLSQPTVSQHVRLLERRLKQTLMVRVGRQAQFTPEGERLLLEARHLLAAHDQVLERLDATRQTRIVLGSTETAADQVLPGLLGALAAAYPDLRTRFHIDRSTQLAESVSKGTVDLAVLLGLGHEVPGRRVGVLPLAWFAAPQWRRPEPTDPMPLVAYVEPCGMRQLALTELGEGGQAVEVTAEATSLDGVVAAARAGLGVAVLPTLGATPTGLVRRRDLPDLGVIGVFLAARRGLDVDLEAAGLAALEEFFDDLLGRRSAAVSTLHAVRPA